MDRIFEDLNSEQRRAVECEDGPVLIVAGAGSGKTRVLTSRIAYLISRGVPPESIMALTFTKKAAGEMKERIAAMVGERSAWKIVMGTFHAVFVRFLREYHELIGYPKDFTIYDTGDSLSAIKTCLKELHLDDKESEKYYKPKDILSRISMAKNNLVTAEAYAKNQQCLMADLHGKRPELHRIFLAYSQLCRKSGVMDFDDILLNMNILLRDHAEARQALELRFEHILVDEYQDTNKAQYTILRRLRIANRNICVVGDDSQSIYAFRGARIENILNFQKDFPGTKIFRLERNYRSTRMIVGASNSIISRNEGRIPKNCVAVGQEGEKIRLIKAYTEQEEALLIASTIISRMRAEGASYRDFAVLYRTNSQSRAIEEALRRRNLPYMVYSGNSFFERAEVKDLMAYFKLAVNHADNESFRRVVNKPARGIGETSFHALEAYAAENGLTLMEAALSDGLPTVLKGAVVQKFREFAGMILSAGSSEDAVRASKDLAMESGLYLYYKADTSVEGQSRFANIEELLNSVSVFKEDRRGEFEEQMMEEGSVKDPSEIPEDQYPVVSLSQFLEEVSLLSNVDITEEEGNNKIALMTVHSSKGLEFPHVIVAGMEENLFPSTGGGMATEQEIEEERRLFYVAVTRAEKSVDLSFASTRMRNGKHESNSPSRFLREIAPQYLENPLRKPEPRTPVHDDDDKPSWPFRRPSFSPVRNQMSRQPQAPPKPVFSSVKPPVIDSDFVPDPMTSFSAGDRIEHNRFGAGRIVEISGEVPDLRAKVQFDQYGPKILLLKHAKLRHI